MSTVDTVTQQVTDYFDCQVRELSQQDYHDVLEEVIADLEGKLDCVNSELEREEE